MDKMHESLWLKFHSCDHAKEKLLHSVPTLVEATGDPFWGSGLNQAQMKECLMEYWPGKNTMGQLLVELRSEM